MNIAMQPARFIVRDKALFEHLAQTFAVIAPGVLNALPTLELQNAINAFYIDRGASGRYYQRAANPSDRTIRTLEDLANALVRE